MLDSGRGYRCRVVDAANGAQSRKWRFAQALRADRRSGEILL
jgi:hypothetical protein